jgi:hypothetical protein
MTSGSPRRARPPRRTVAGVATTALVIIALATPYGVLGPIVDDLIPDIGRPPPLPSPSPLLIGTPARPVPEPPVVHGRTADPGGVVHEVPASIDPTGAADVTLAIQMYLDGVPDGSTIRFAPAGRYRIEGTIRVQGRRGLTIDGRGATFVATSQTEDPDRAHWWIDDSTAIHVRDLSIEGAHPEPGTYVAGFEWQHGIQIYGGSDIEIGPGVTTSGNQGDGIYIARWADGVHIHDCRISWNGRMGIAVVAGRNVIIERCRLDNIAFSAFDIEPNEASDPPEGAERITIRDNVVDGPVVSKFFAMAGFGPISDVLVTRNLVTGARNGIAVDARPIEGTPRRSDITITDNVGAGVFSGGGGIDAVMHFWTIDRLTVTGNRQAVEPGGIRFAIGDDWSDVRIEGNDCPGCAD